MPSASRLALLVIDMQQGLFASEQSRYRSANVVANINFMIGIRYSIGMNEIFEEALGIQPDAKNTSLMLNLGFLY